MEGNIPSRTDFPLDLAGLVTKFNIKNQQLREAGGIQRKCIVVILSTKRREK